ncbi:MAG: Wzz/FepE/Etk N-terminal domain-containing protein [Oscillospiraceae bacterium]|nr:Wzz/FepE/Etk N-terminal domain-containing protein [Oscillospiraceae bacterium]MDD4367622.1 Wzz/FepE/Etk N-terminal domain-containing protein [Oscillospiraceae bacterium]
MQDNSSEEREISLIELWNSFKQHLRPIIITAMLAGLLTFAVSSFVLPKKYQAAVKLYVSTTATNNGSDLNALNYAQKIVNTYIEMLRTNSFYEKVVAADDENLTAAQLSDMLDFELLNSTEVFSVTVTSGSPLQAKRIADTIASLAPQTIADLNDNASLHVVDSPLLPTAPSSPNTKRNTALGLLVGLVLAYAFFLIRDLLDKTIYDEDDLHNRYDYPLLATIPSFSKKGR